MEPILIVGAGISGTSAYDLLKTLGFDQIKIFDQNPAKGDFNQPEQALTFKPKTLVVSPGVPLKTGWIQSLIQSNIVLTSELEIAFDLLEKEQVIAVTGAIGKSTTVSLLECGAKSFSPNSFAGGNLGAPLASYVNDKLTGKRDSAEWIILELSSYQLENFKNFSCKYSAITYLTPNHLERYGSLEDYYAVKLSLIEKSKVLCVCNSHGGDLKRIVAEKASGATNIDWTDRTDPRLKTYGQFSSMMVGSHNLDNLAVATTLARLAGWPATAFLAMSRFTGLPHRLENLGKKNGVTFINDSKSTTIESVLQAIHSLVPDLKEDQTLLVLLGGRDKNLPWERLKTLYKLDHVHYAFFGECGHLAQEKSGLPGEIFPKLKDCLGEVFNFVRLGDSVLLSPGGTSLDEFKSFEDRGEYLRNWMKN